MKFFKAENFYNFVDFCATAKKFFAQNFSYSNLMCEFTMENFEIHENFFAKSCVPLIMVSW